MTFTFDGTALINLVLLLAVLAFMWKLNRDVGASERRLTDRIEALRLEFKQDLAKLATHTDALAVRMTALTERIARIEGRMDIPWERHRFTGVSASEEEAIPNR